MRERVRDGKRVRERQRERAREREREREERRCEACSVDGRTRPNRTR